MWHINQELLKGVYSARLLGSGSNSSLGDQVLIKWIIPVRLTNEEHSAAIVSRYDLLVGQWLTLWRVGQYVSSSTVILIDSEADALIQVYLGSESIQEYKVWDVSSPFDYHL